ncbi:MAG TPA: phage BR0599 family protein [Methanosarcinales archaeon]|nr:phage BR0599 family protein [Methanosarcinales archaeon]
MSYDSIEASVNEGKPIELYDFAAGVTHYRYTSGPEDVTYSTQVYSTEMISRSELELSDNAFKNELEIKINRDNIFAQKFIEAPIDGMVSLTIYRGHGTDFVTFWAGVISQVSFNSDEIVISASPRTSSMSRIGLRRKYQKLCNHPLYSGLCTVVPSSFKVTGTIASVDGTTIVSGDFATKANGWFLGGKFVLGSAERLITSHSGSTITISRKINAAVAGNSFTAYAGCDHTQLTCLNKFSNLLNYGGQPWIPVKNPFSGDAIM